MTINPIKIMKTSFVIIIFLLILAVLIELAKQVYYRKKTGRNLMKDLRSTQLPFRELLLQQKENMKSMNPAVPKELLHKKPTGIFFGKAGNKYVTAPPCLDMHVVLIGGAGSGKTSCISIPTLRSWMDAGGAALILDIKGELSRNGLTPKQRENAKIFAPARNSDVGFNPFYFAQQTANPVQSIREIALALIEKPADIKDPFWITGAQNILTAALLYGFEQSMSFVDVIKWLLRSEPDDVIQEIRESNCEAAIAFASQYANLKEETLGGIFGEIVNNLVVFATDPQVMGALQRENLITPEDLDNGISVILEIPEERLEQWQSLLTCILNLYIKAWERREPGQRPVLVLLEEAARCGRLNLGALNTLRDKKIRFFIVLQSTSQLWATYGEHNAKIYLDSCNFKICLRASEPSTQRWMSDLCGTYSRPTVSRSYGRTDLENVSFTLSEQEKRVIKPEEFGHLGEDLILIHSFKGGFCRVKKAPYYKK